MRVPQNSNVVSDQIISFPRLAREGEKPVLFRRVEILDKEKEETIVFLSNLLAFGATTIAAIYKDRWEVELFFKSLKQLCKIKTFVGTSANAVKTQVWTALIAMLVLKYLQLKSTFPGRYRRWRRCCGSNSSSIAICGCGWTILLRCRRLWLACTTMRNNWKSRGRRKLDSRQPIKRSNLDFRRKVRSN